MNLDDWKVSVLARLPIRAKTLATHNSAYRCHVHDAIALCSFQVAPESRDILM